MKQRLLLYYTFLIVATWGIGSVCAASTLAGGVSGRKADAQDAPTVQFATAAAVATEGEGRAIVTVMLSAPPPRDAEVTVSVQGGTASVESDLSLGARSTTLKFLADEKRSQRVVLTPVADQEVEGVEFVDLVLQSDDLAVGAPGTFRLWICDATLYPEMRARALTDQLRADFRPVTMLSAEQAADTLLGVVWNDAEAVRGVFTGTQATVDPSDDPKAVAREQGLVIDHIWPMSLKADAAARRDLHLLIPVQEDVKATRQQGRAFAAEDAPGGEATPYLRPRDGIKGDLARALLYFHTMYPEQADPEVLERLKPTLVQWIDDDPVDAPELQRNTLIARYQGMPNPFVVAPQLAERAFNLRGTYPTPTVSFVRPNASANEADSVAVVEVTVTGMGDEALTLDLVLDEEASTIDPGDLSGFRRRTITFSAGASDGTVRRVRVPIARDEETEGRERASFMLENMSGFAQAGEVSRYGLSVENAEPPSKTRSSQVVIGSPYPNPLSPGRGSTVRFDLTMKEAMPLTVEVFSTLGQRVRARSYSAGEAEQIEAIEIDGKDLPSVLYIVRLRGPSFSTTETFVVVR